MTPTLTPDAAERIRLAAHEGEHEGEPAPGEGEPPAEGQPPQEPAQEPVQPTPDPDVSPPPPPGATQGRARREPDGEPSRRELQAFAREQERHEQVIRELMGADVAAFVPCSHCQGIGLTPPEPEPRTHEHFKACETCAGYGAVLTGSRRQGNELRDCPACGGRGYLEALNSQGQPLAGGQGMPVPNAGGAVVLPVPEVAPPANGAASEVTFGVPTWMGDPNVGR